MLGVTLNLVDGFIRTDVYSKPTDSHLYLSYPITSHPKHVFKAIPFGVALRLRRDCSEDAFGEKMRRMYELFGEPRLQGLSYPHKGLI